MFSTIRYADAFMLIIRRHDAMLTPPPFCHAADAAVFHACHTYFVPPYGGVVVQVERRQ